MKVSPHNAHLSFYRDVFKAVAARDHRLKTLRRLIFLTPAVAAQKLRCNLAGQVLRDTALLGLRIEICDL